jgi:hypothetical protein
MFAAGPRITFTGSTERHGFGMQRIHQFRAFDIKGHHGTIADSLAYHIQAVYI